MFIKSLTDGTIIHIVSTGEGTGDVKSLIIRPPYWKRANAEWEERRKEYYPFLEPDIKHKLEVE